MKHKNRFGSDCNITSLYSVHLGHDFITDVLELKLPRPANGKKVENTSLYRSLLYAILEGAAMELGISRTEINGCIYYSENETNIVLFDEVPGGAGHVKKISMNIENTLKQAKYKVSGVCGCGEDSSCYGCLQNYGNQSYHDTLRRGLALDYLNGFFR